MGNPDATAEAPPEVDDGFLDDAAAEEPIETRTVAKEEVFPEGADCEEAMTCVEMSITRKIVTADGEEDLRIRSGFHLHVDANECEVEPMVEGALLLSRWMPTEEDVAAHIAACREELAAQTSGETTA